jgi:predicted lipoprotein with Yx(FWY)xxD motif
MTRNRWASTLACAALTLTLGACGSDDREQPAGANVSVEQIDGVGAVLVDGDGAALYTSDQEEDGTIRCTGRCTDFWIPLDAGSSAPTATDEVGGKLATVERPDGGMQVTYDGKPLYRFSEDPAPGQVTGNGLADEFGGRTFTWRAAKTAGAASGDSGGGRGYGY